MTLFVFVVLSCLSLGFQADYNTPDICKRIQATDEDVVQEMQKPGPLDQNIMFEKIKKYIAAIDELIKCLHSDKDGTYKIAKDIIDKKGARFVQDVPWTWRLARQDWGWDGRVIQDFLNYRMEVMEAWMDVEKYFDPTAVIPQELYTESYEESAKKAS